MTRWTIVGTGVVILAIGAHWLAQALGLVAALGLEPNLVVALIALAIGGAVLYAGLQATGGDEEGVRLTDWTSTRRRGTEPPKRDDGSGR